MTMNNQTKQDDIICIYHLPISFCNDGFAAAWIVHNHYIVTEHSVQLFPTNYHHQLSPPLEECRDRYVYIVDFSYPATQLQQIADVAKEVILIDHHKSALPLLDVSTDFFPPWVHLIIDMANSGAMLVWKHFYGNSEPPMIVKYVEDRDMWWKALDNCDNIHYALISYEPIVEIWDQLANQLEPINTLSYDVLVDQGAAIQRYNKKWITNYLLSSTKEVLLDGHMIPSINIPGIFASDAAGILATNRPFALAWYTSKTHRHCSLRSNSSYAHHVDVEEIAKKFGGGGHKHAAGFSLPITDTKDFTLQSN